MFVRWPEIISWLKRAKLAYKSEYSGCIFLYQFYSFWGRFESRVDLESRAPECQTIVSPTMLFLVQVSIMFYFTN